MLLWSFSLDLFLCLNFSPLQFSAVVPVNSMAWPRPHRQVLLFVASDWKGN